MGTAPFVFSGAVALLAYTYGVYPAIIGLLARLTPRPVRARLDYCPRVTVIIVVRNEAARIEAKLASCLAQDYPAGRLDVLVADDGSCDGTVDRVRAFGHARVRLVAFAQPRGKSACINDAMQSCETDVVVLTDARQMLHPRAVRRLVADLADPGVGAVGGELVFVDCDGSAHARGMGAYWRFETFLRNAESSIHSSPGLSGALYALRRSCFRPIAPDTILDDVAIPMQVVRQGFRAVSQPLAVAYDHVTTSPAQERRRKIRTLAGNYQLLVRAPWLVVPWRNPIALQFISHKVLRLFGPWALLAALVSNGVLALDAPLIWGGPLALQAGLYGLAWRAQRRPGTAWGMPARLAATFVALNAYAVLGLLEFLGNRDLHRWGGTAPPRE